MGSIVNSIVAKPVMNAVRYFSFVQRRSTMLLFKILSSVRIDIQMNYTINATEMQQKTNIFSINDL